MPYLVLGSDVPADLVGVAAIAMAGAVATLWRRCVVLEDRNQANLRELLDTVHTLTEAIHQNTKAIDDASKVA